MTVNATLESILSLAGKGYTVKFSRDASHRQVLRIELSKGINHHVQLVDISNLSVQVSGMSLDQMISHYLDKAEWEYNYDFPNEEDV
jgi:hypothetical protein